MDDDWRLMGQDRYLQGRRLRWRVWWPQREGWDHDHCAFCFAEFSNQPAVEGHPTQSSGYVTEDDYHWVCRSCFEDFKGRFGWSEDP